MSGAPQDYFSKDYFEARDRFLRAAKQVGATITSVEHPTATGPGGRSIYMDCAMLGAPDAADALVVISGTHGPEGYCGSGVQTGLLLDGQAATWAKSMRVILIHAHNAYGFAWDTLPKAFKGRFPPHNPMYSSGLLLAGSERVWMGGESALDFQDGILTAREIGDMDLQHTRLAILSACKSGLGEANSSEGVYGLQRAFKIAGARQVLVTLWEIPDSPDTRDFIGQFTSRWLASGDARAALRETQLDFFRRGKSVQVWGAWVLI